MKIDVVIPSFNDDRVTETIDSIISCDLKNIDLRIILQVGASKPNFINYIQKKFNFVEIDRTTDEGIFDGINKGLKKCSGDLVLTLGSDDRISNDKTFQLVRKKWREGFDCILTDLQYTDENWVPVRFWPAREISLRNYFLGYQHAHFALFISPHYYKELKYFNIKNIVNADYEFFWVLTKHLNKEKIKSGIVSEVCVQMKQGGNSSQSIMIILKHQYRLIKFGLKRAPLLLPGILIFKWYHKFIQIIYCRLPQWVKKRI